MDPTKGGTTDRIVRTSRNIRRTSDTTESDVRDGSVYVVKEVFSQGSERTCVFSGEYKDIHFK